MVIEVSDYDPEWPDRFEALRAEYAEALDRAGVPFVGIEHVGSTSVPGLAAKPVIDVDVVVTEAEVSAASGVMESIGFVALGELGIPGRRAFRAPDRLPRTNSYVVEAGCLSLRNHLGVRDVLRRDPALCVEYAAVKRALAARASDIDEYVRGKSVTLQKILASAGLSDDELRSIDANQVPALDHPTPGNH